MKKIHCVVWNENKLYVARALEVEVASQGKDEKEAITNLKEALELYFEDNSELQLTSVKQPQVKDLTIQVNA